jgi:hypothetical protein
MKKSMYSAMAVVALVLLATLLVCPVSGLALPINTIPTTAPATTATPATITSAPHAEGIPATDTPAVTHASSVTNGAVVAKPSISATSSSITPTAGDLLTLSGVAKGGNLASGVRMWIFAGNYVNVTTVPVNADGTFLKTYPTTGLPAATYYVFVQSPGNDGTFDIDLYDAGIYSGQVVNTRTKVMIFNFTGAGSIQDAAASKALSDALNQPVNDDVYTKLTFQLTAATTLAAASPAASPAATAVPAAIPTKSPLPFEVTAGALVISGCCAAFCMRKIP